MPKKLPDMQFVLLSTASWCRSRHRQHTRRPHRRRQPAPVSYSMAGREDRVPNALGGLIGGAIVDNSFGASAIPFAAAVVPALALLFILSQEHGSSVAPALSRPSLKEGTL
jgi:hypothetical protein